MVVRFSFVPAASTADPEIREVLRATGVAASEVTEVVHGTTTASNTILQKVGARTGVLTTRGFREAEVRQVARWMCEVLESIDDDARLARIRDAVHELCRQFPVYRHG